MLSPEEIDALPERLRRRYWAAWIGEGCVGLSAVTLVEAESGCREWLAMAADLQPGDIVRLNTGESEVVTVHRDGFDPGDGGDRWPGQFVSVRDRDGTYLVGMQQIIERKGRTTCANTSPQLVLL